MSLNIIIKNRPHKFGKTRSEHEENIRREWGMPTLTDEQLDKCKYLEKRMYWKENNKKSYFDQFQIGRVR